MPERYEADLPNRRGVRDPELQSRLAADDMLADPGDEDSHDVLEAGDRCIAKVSLCIPTQYGEAWFTYGAETKVFDGELEEEAFGRLATVVNSRVLDLANDALVKVNEFQTQQVEAATHRRITPRG